MLSRLSFGGAPVSGLWLGGVSAGMYLLISMRSWVIQLRAVKSKKSTSARAKATGLR
jgi:hypothetical protein